MVSAFLNGLSKALEELSRRCWTALRVARVVVVARDCREQARRSELEADVREAMAMVLWRGGEKKKGEFGVRVVDEWVGDDVVIRVN